MIILIRHAQSEGNKNREIHQYIPDHRVKLTPDGLEQVRTCLITFRTSLTSLMCIVKPFCTEIGNYLVNL